MAKHNDVVAESRKQFDFSGLDSVFHPQTEGRAVITHKTQQYFRGQAWVATDGTETVIPEKEPVWNPVDAEAVARREASLAYTSPECIRRVSGHLIKEHASDEE